MAINKKKLPKLTPENITNRELSTIAFNQRVLALAQNPDIPLLERLKFIAIIGNNTDEFFMVRVGSQIQKHQVGIETRSVDGYTPGELLNEIRDRSIALIDEQRKTMHTLLEELHVHGVHILTVQELDPPVREVVRTYFQNEVFPVLTPLAADHARPFPFISNLSLNIGVYLRRGVEHGGHVDFVRIKVPDALSRLVNLSALMKKYLEETIEGDHLLWLEDVIANNLDLLFPGMEIIETSPFRVTRNADIDYEHEREAELMDISAVIEAGVRKREFGSVTRLTVPRMISPRMLKRLIGELDINPERDVYLIDGILGSSSLFELAKLNYPHLKYRPYVPRYPDLWPQGGGDIFAAIRRNDILIHMPYDSFMPVEEFYRVAARDPNVLAIKATLYRVGENAPVVQALMEARENDKQVAVLVELKARFDEANNLEWARALEQKGVHVTYGVEKLPVKTHAKVTLVVRKETDGLRCYVHLGTGNYNASTARLYGDLGLFTANPQIAEDATRLFNRLTGYAPDTQYTHLLVAPEFLKPSFLKLIDNEIEAAQAGKQARLVFKMNQLEEEVMIQKLYQASQAGVKIDLIVRGLCRLRPGIAELSENIRVLSVLGRFLEHSRIYYFHNAPPNQRIYAGSADLMRRNLNNRVETIFPILDPRLQEKVMRILATDFQGTEGVWELLPNGDYAPIQVPKGVKVRHSQNVFMRNSAGLEINL